jgi:hypothetical protein
VTTTITESPRQRGRTLAAIARSIPSCRIDGATHPATLSRWITKGVSMRDGSRLKLAAIRAPGGWLVADEAVDDFLERLTADRTGEPAPAPPSATAARQRELARVAHALEVEGFGGTRHPDTEKGEPAASPKRGPSRPRKVRPSPAGA